MFVARCAVGISYTVKEVFGIKHFLQTLMVIGVGDGTLVGDGLSEFRRELCKEVACRVVGHLGRSCVNGLHAAQHDKDCAYPCHDHADVFLCDLHNPTKLKKSNSSPLAVGGINTSPADSFYSSCSSFFLLLYNQTAKTNVPAIIRHFLIVSESLVVNPVPQKGSDGNDSITVPFA